MEDSQELKRYSIYICCFMAHSQKNKRNWSKNYSEYIHSFIYLLGVIRLIMQHFSNVITLKMLQIFFHCSPLLEYFLQDLSLCITIYNIYLTNVSFLIIQFTHLFPLLLLYYLVLGCWLEIGKAIMINDFPLPFLPFFFFFFFALLCAFFPWVKEREGNDRRK